MKEEVRDILAEALDEGLGMAHPKGRGMEVEIAREDFDRIVDEYTNILMERIREVIE